MNTVRVRMYRQGLGDCFLLTFPGSRRPIHVLIDCGVLKGTPDARNVMTRVAADIVKTTGGRLDVLVVTHEHWDHVSGFLQAREIFQALPVGQVWMAWTENPRDRRARELRQVRARTLRAVTAAAQKLHAASLAGAKQALESLDNLLGFHGGISAAARQTTSKAMQWARTETGGETLYCTPGSEPLTIPGLSGVRVFVLGPPRDSKLIRKSDPSKRQSEVYQLAATASANMGFLAALDAVQSNTEDAFQPFDDWFRLSDGDTAGRAFMSTRYEAEDQQWRSIEHDWLGAATGLALQLDSDTNNTSLALAFELTKSGRVLLFPGDAQVGNWLSWLPLEWETKHKGKPVTGRDLLARTVLYKVGHHGSHNATLRQNGLELMSSDELVAMLPVFRPTAKKLDWNMPFPSLARRLHVKTKGRILDLEHGVKSGDGNIDATEWKRFVGRTAVNDISIDYHVPL